MEKEIFKHRLPDFEKLRAFGFRERNGIFTYKTLIAERQLQMERSITKSGCVHAKVVDPESDSEYVLHRNPQAEGAFVGMVRSNFYDILKAVAAGCFVSDLFKGELTRTVTEYIKNTYGDRPEFLWKQFPEYAVFRRKDTVKWYGVLMRLSKRKLGLDSDETVDILDLRIKSGQIGALLDNKRYFPGYHMSKKHWYTVCIDGSVPVEEICRRIDISYELAIK